MQSLIEHAPTTEMLHSSFNLEGGDRNELISLIKPEMYSYVSLWHQQCRIYLAFCHMCLKHYPNEHIL